MSQFQVEAITAPVEHALSAVTADLARGFKEAMSETRKDVQKANRNEFLTAGEGDWRPIKPRSLKGRQVNTAPGAENQPLIDTGELMASVTQDGVQHSILTETPFELTLGTDRADSMRHQFGSSDGHEPARPFLFLSDQEQHEVELIFERDLDKRISRVTR